MCYRFYGLFYIRITIVSLLWLLSLSVKSCYTGFMLSFTIPILPITVRQDSDKKMQRYEVPGLELDFVPGQEFGRKEFTGAFVAGGKDGLAISFCAELPGARNSQPASFEVDSAPNPKSWVFNHSCLELFVQPEGSDFYYGWEIDAAGSCLDYRVAVGEGKLAATCDCLSDPAAGVLMQEIAGQKLFFDYDWQSHASWRMEVADEFWYLELFIPWRDFGLDNTIENPVTPADGSCWRATINRIIPVGRAAASSGDRALALQSLLDFEGVEVVPRFHQPNLFAEFQWEKVVRR